LLRGGPDIYGAGSLKRRTQRELQERPVTNEMQEARSAWAIELRPGTRSFESRLDRLARRHRAMKNQNTPIQYVGGTA